MNAVDPRQAAYAIVGLFAATLVACDDQVDPTAVSQGESAQVIIDDPDTGPTAALMPTVPGATPETSPAVLTVAVCVAADVHWNGTPGTVAFDASRATAVSWRV